MDEREIKEQLRQLEDSQVVHIHGHEIARQSGNLGLYVVDGVPLSLETAAYVISVPFQWIAPNLHISDEIIMQSPEWREENESEIAPPIEINEWTDLDNFDEYEAKEQGWSQELLTAAIHEIQRRDLDTQEQK